MKTHVIDITPNALPEDAERIEAVNAVIEFALERLGAVPCVLKAWVGLAFVGTALLDLAARRAAPEHRDLVRDWAREAGAGKFDAIHFYTAKGNA